MAWYRRKEQASRGVAATGRYDGVAAAARREKRKHWLVKGAIVGGLIIVTMLAFGRGQIFQHTVQVGEVWRQENFAAPFLYAIEKPPEVVADERARVRAETPPFFRVVPNAMEALVLRHDSLALRIETALDARASYEMNLLRGRRTEALLDSIAYVEARGRVGLLITPLQWILLVRSYNERIPGLQSTVRVLTRGPRLDRVLLSEVKSISTQLANLGVLDVRRDSLNADVIVVRDDAARTQEEVERTRVSGVNEAFRIGQDALAARYAGSDTMAVAAAMLGAVLRPTLLYDEEATRAEWARRELDISPNFRVVRQNEIIVRRGDVVTEEIQRKLVSLERQQSERRGQRLAWEAVTGQLVLTFVVYLIFFLYLFLLRRSIFDDNRMMALTAIQFAFVIGLFAVALRVPGVDMYVVPVSIVSVLLTVIFDSRVAIFATVTLALVGSLLLNLDFAFALSTLFAGSLAVFSVRDIRNRGQFFISAGLVFVGYLVVLIATFLVLQSATERLLSTLIFVGINSVLLLLAYPLLWVFERTFGLTTDLTLLELSDTNRPLIKELSLRAPGTFNHVLQVSNLAEAAASAVGANALLTRVGTLYHDIGKMVKPEYFVENQRGGVNPHDQLKPRMSALIIASHVKEGIEIGRRHKLPQRVLDFIPMHHGTTRIEYFYRRAVDQRKPGDPDILESEFRYPGPRPNSKETSILMLADSVEAASRSLDSPSHKRLESLIESLVDARREDGQLDDTDLTFRDIRVIKETFLTMLMGIYHVRVKYPGEESETAETEPVAALDSSGGNDSADAVG